MAEINQLLAEQEAIEAKRFFLSSGWEAGRADGHRAHTERAPCAPSPAQTPARFLGALSAGAVYAFIRSCRWLRHAAVSPGAIAAAGAGIGRSAPPAPRPRPRRDPRPAASALRPRRAAGGAGGWGQVAAGGALPTPLQIPVPVRASASPPLARPGAPCSVAFSTCTGRTWRTAATPRGCSRTTPSAPGPPPRWLCPRRISDGGCGSAPPGSAPSTSPSAPAAPSPPVAPRPPPAAAPGRPPPAAFMRREARREPTTAPAGGPAASCPSPSPWARPPTPAGGGSRRRLLAPPAAAAPPQPGRSGGGRAGGRSGIPGGRNRRSGYCCRAESISLSLSGSAACRCLRYLHVSLKKRI